MGKFAPFSRFARPEWERRFLLYRFPPNAQVECVRKIVDRYITGTSLRLRRVTDSDGSTVFKLTQKHNHNALGALQGELTTIYLAEEEYNILAALPASLLEKTRNSVPPFGIDVFKGRLMGLLLAEAEFSSAEEAETLGLPPFLSKEVTSDPRWTGGFLSVATREQVGECLREFGIPFE
jgi:CYTH domain-containing protein